MAYTTVLRWAKDQVDRYDKQALGRLVEYFQVQSGEVLQYVQTRTVRSEW